MQILVSFGLKVTEICCHKINMNTKEKDIIKRILNGTAIYKSMYGHMTLDIIYELGLVQLRSHEPFCALSYTVNI